MTEHEGNLSNYARLIANVSANAILNLIISFHPSVILLLRDYKS
ncbi:hypothetical protein CM318V1_470112 [Carnobacterium maltaromaticum]|nr:conserved hypothetical protein [Carnobacterium maltaromaticum]CRH19542.1 hypothetical protein CM318V1_470112 [Carnobacterium maltaromaticum]